MYEFVTDKQFLKSALGECEMILYELVIRLRDIGIRSQFILIGSGARNMVTRNGKGSPDLDFNLKILSPVDPICPRDLKLTVRKVLNSVLRDFGYPDAKDSRSVLTVYFPASSRAQDAIFSMDLGIVRQDEDGNWFRLIHLKTGFEQYDQYEWRMAPKSDHIREKTRMIKAAGRWERVREMYLDQKNHYLINDDHSHPSCVCYIEAVNNVYNELFQ